MRLFCPTGQIRFVKSKVQKSPMSTTCRLLCMGLFSRFLIVRPQNTSPARLILPEMARALASAIHLQRGNKSFLRDVDLAELPHLLLAFLLLLQKFALT